MAEDRTGKDPQVQYAEAQPEGHLPGTEKKKRPYPYGSAVLLYLPDSQKETSRAENTSKVHSHFYGSREKKRIP